MFLYELAVFISLLNFVCACYSASTFQATCLSLLRISFSITLLVWMMSLIVL